MSLRVTETDGRPWRLSLRVPAWAAGAELVTLDGRQPATPGMAVVDRRFAAGDEVTLHLPVTPRWTTADPRIDAIRGCVAVERGPVVLCAESVDLPGGRAVDRLRVDPTVPPRDGDGSVIVAGHLIDPPDRAWPYGEEVGSADAAGPDVEVIPYHRWANRGPSTMRVWLPTTD